MKKLGAIIIILSCNLIVAAQNVGIGTTTPENMLHIFKGSAGSVTAFSAPLVVENSANCYINMLSPEASATGILFGKPSNNISGGIVYNDVSFNPNGFDFRTNGNISRMILDNAGNLGVGTTAPENYKLKISYNDDNIDASGQKGLDIENTSGNFGDRQDWEIYTAPINNFSDGGLVFFLNSSYRASVNAQTGSWASISDEHLKTNISPMSTMLEKIKQLKPSTYQFKNTKDSTEYNGFIAQDVMKIFPDLVMHNVDPGRKLEVYAMNYSGFGVLAIKGIQELEPIIEEQKKINEEQKIEIVALKERLSKLETALAEVLSQKDIKASINNVTLEQNIPNPLDRSTTIRYSIPANSKNAILVVTDITGKVIKQIQLGSASNGNVSIDATGLSGGSYSYSIIVDGKLMQTKTMIVAKAKVG